MNRRAASVLTRRGASSQLAEAVDLGLVTGPESALAARLVAARPVLEQSAELPEQTRQAQRARLVAVASVRPPTSGVTAGAGGRSAPPAAAGHPRRTVIALASVISLLGLGGVLGAASLSLPGDPFYDVKRGQETVELALSSGDQAKAEQHLAMAATRLREVRGLIEGRDALDASFTPSAGAGASTAERLDRVAGTLAAMDVSTRSGTMLLTDLWRQGHDAVPLRTLELWARSQSSQLDALLPRLDSSGRDQAEVTLTLLHAVDNQAGELRATSLCPRGCDPGKGVPRTPSEPVRPADVRPPVDPDLPTPPTGPATPTPTSPPAPQSPGATSAPVPASPPSAGSPARPDVRPPSSPTVSSVVPEAPGPPSEPLPSPAPLPPAPLPPAPLPPAPPSPAPLPPAQPSPAPQSPAPLPDIPVPATPVPVVPQPDLPVPRAPLPDVVQTDVQAAPDPLPGVQPADVSSPPEATVPPASLPEPDAIQPPSVTLAAGTPPRSGDG